MRVLAGRVAPGAAAPAEDVGEQRQPARTAGRPPETRRPGTRPGWRRPRGRAAGRESASTSTSVSRCTARWRALERRREDRVEDRALGRDHAHAGWSARRSAAPRGPRKRAHREVDVPACVLAIGTFMPDGTCGLEPDEVDVAARRRRPATRACTRTGGVPSKPSSSRKPSAATARPGHAAERGLGAARGHAPAALHGRAAPSSVPWRRTARRRARLPRRQAASCASRSPSVEAGSRTFAPIRS